MTKMMIIEHDCSLLPQRLSKEDADRSAQLMVKLRQDGNANANKSLIHVSNCARDRIGALSGFDHSTKLGAMGK